MLMLNQAMNQKSEILTVQSYPDYGRLVRNTMQSSSR